MNNSGGDPAGKKKKPRRLVCPRFACWDRLALPAGVLVFARKCSSRLVRSRAGWRPLRHSQFLVLGAATKMWVRVPPPYQLVSTRPHEAESCPTELLPSARLPSRAEGSNKGQPAPFLLGVCVSGTRPVSRDW